MLLGLSERPLGNLLVGYIGHNRDGSARSNLAAANATIPTVGGLVLEARGGRTAQAVHAPRH